MKHDAKGNKDLFDFAQSLSNISLVKETQDTITKKYYDTSWVIISNVINVQFLGGREE